MVKPGRAANTPESVHFPSMVCGEGGCVEGPGVPCWTGTRERGRSWPRGWACCLPRAVRGLRRGLTRLVHLRVCGEPRPGRCPSWRRPPAPAHLLMLLSEEIGVLAQREGLTMLPGANRSPPGDDHGQTPALHVPGRSHSIPSSLSLGSKGKHAGDRGPRQAADGPGDRLCPAGCGRAAGGASESASDGRPTARRPHQSSLSCRLVRGGPSLHPAGSRGSDSSRLRCSA